MSTSLNSPKFMEALKDVINILLAGKAPSPLAPILVSAPVVAVIKADSSIRPIAVGETLRRLVSKLAMRHALTVTSTILAPFQYGVGVHCGAEAMLMGVNRLISDPKCGQSLTFLKVDFINAFNTIKRQTFIQATKVHIPAIAHWVQFCYGQPALLFSGTDILTASTGVQQGDPIGPLLFSLALHPLLKDLSNTLPPHSRILAYLDDQLISTNSPRNAVKALKWLHEVGPQYGLHVSPSKSMIWCLRPPLVPIVIPPHLGYYCSESGFDLLGGCVSRDPTLPPGRYSGE